MSGPLVDKIKLPPEYDKRRKLTAKDRERIKRLYFKSGWKIRRIAEEYQGKCSRRLIQFILFPERAAKNAEYQRRSKRWLFNYDRESHTKRIKDLRRRKRELLKKGIIKLETGKEVKI